MKILLIEPDDRSVPGLSFGGLFVMEPMSLELIAGAVPEDEVLIVDLRLDPCNLEYYLQTFKPEVVGVTGITALHDEMNSVLREAKASGAFTVAGGPHASFAYSELQADAVVIGEGEGTFRRLVATLASTDKRLDLVPNLALKQGKKYILTQRQVYKRWPFPRRCFAREYQYGAFGCLTTMVEATRGCPHRCSFCVTPKLFSGRYRVRPPGDLASYIATRPEEVVMFPDANVMASPGYVRTLLSTLRSANISKQYGVAVRADDVVNNADLIRTWSELGLSFAFIGYEGYTQQQLDSYGKETTLDMNQTCVSILNNCGVVSIGTLIVQPEWCKADFDRALAYAKSLRSDVTLFSILTPFPGAPLSEQYKPTAPYKNFDILHAVTETALPYSVFQKQFTRISKRVLASVASLRLLLKLFRLRLLRRRSLRTLPRLFKYIRQL